MSDVLETLKKLPPICAAILPGYNVNKILIRRGESGYYPAPAKLDVAKFNASRGITAAQAEAMQVGSMFGWEVPGADPDNWND